MKHQILLALFCCLSCSSLTKAENDTEKWPTLKPDWYYCYEFTWFGPDYNQVNGYNGTCADYLEETRADGVPCASPIVINTNGTFPNMDYLWDNHRASILCKRSENQRCVRYTYYLDSKVNNITYMCAKVQEAGSGSIINDGCYMEKAVDGYQREVCVCKSIRGIFRPCNGVEFNQVTFGLLLVCTAWNFIIRKYLF